MSYTVWVYDHDAAAHHCNELNDDTFEDLEVAAASAKLRTKETNYNTGWAKVIDNHIAGRMGDAGVVLRFHKDKNGQVYPSYVRETMGVQAV